MALQDGQEGVVLSHLNGPEGVDLLTKLGHRVCLAESGVSG